MSLLKNLCEKNFFLIFFFLCVYQVFAVLFGFNLGLISEILPGTAVLGLSVILLNSYNQLFLMKIPKNFLLFLIVIFLLSSFFIIYSNFLIERFDSVGRSSVLYITSFILGIITWTIFGSAFYFSVKNRVSQFQVVVASLILLILFILSNNGFNQIDYVKININDDYVISHLVLGGFIIYPIIYLQTLSRGLVVYWVISINLIVLFMIGGRSDLLIYIISCFIFYTYFIENNRFIVSIIFASIFAGVISLLLYIIGFSNFKLFSGISSIFSGEDSSEKARADFLLNNLQDLPNKILIGNPNYFIDKNNSLGTYIHNILSIWEFFGFLFFIFIFYILLKNYIYLNENRIRLMLSIEGRFGVFFFIFVFLEIIFAKSTFYYPFWFAIGYLFMLSAFPKVNKLS